MHRSHRNSICARLSLLLCFAACIADRAIAQENVVIVLDDSGSMSDRMSSGQTRIETARNALVKVLGQFGKNTKLGLLLLNGSYPKAHWAVPLEPLSTAEAIREVKSITASGGTPLGERMRDGAEALLNLREKQIYGTYRLLIVTDGEANDSRLLNGYLPDILSRGLIVDAIGVDMKQDHSLAKRVHSYRRADDDAALEKALQEVFAERVDASSDGNEADYSLMDAIESETAKEVLAAMSRPNNAPINEVNWPTAWDAPKGGGNSLGATLFTGFMFCVFPVVVLFVVIAVGLSKLQGKKTRRYR